MKMVKLIKQKSNENMFGELVSVRTKDHIDLVGFLSICKSKNNRLFVMTHGRGGNLHSGFTSFLKPLCQSAHQSGYDFLSVSDRGSGFYRIYDEFEKCVIDYSAWVNFCKKRGYEKIVLGGHSYGPLKITHFYSQIKPKEVGGLFYLAPTNTYGIWKKQIGNKAAKYSKLAKELIKEKRGSDLMPKEVYYKPISAKSYHSLYGIQSKIHMFDFHNPNFDYKILKSIGIPVLVVVGDKDKPEFDAAPEEKIEIFNKYVREATCVLIKGGDHVLAGKNRELLFSIRKWLSEKV